MPALKELQTMYPELKDFELVPDGSGIWLWGYGSYPEGSILAGQHKQQRIEHWEDVNTALLACPLVNHRVDGTCNLPSSMLVTVSDVAPDWFDPADAGECWEAEEGDFC